MQVYAIAAYPEYVEELTPVCPVPPGALSIDYLIGEPAARGRGLGAALIAAAVARGFADHPDAQDVIVPVAAGNTASLRALQRAGATWYADGELTPDNPIDPPATTSCTGSSGRSRAATRRPSSAAGSAAPCRRPRRACRSRRGSTS